MAFVEFYLTCVPDSILIKTKLSIFPENNEKYESYDETNQDTTHLDTSENKFLDFPFLKHPTTIKYIKRSKTMFIMRGLPGSGKSTIVKKIQSTYPNTGISSADNYFYKDGIYRFDVNKLGEAHDDCRQRTGQYCDKKCHVVVIDNTNVKYWEMKAYLDIAFSTSYVVVIVEPRTPWRFNPDELATKTKHGVSRELLYRKVQIYQNVVPSYYAWFLNEDDSKYLLKIARKLVEECLEKIPELKEYLLCNWRNIHFDNKALSTRLAGIFQRDDSNDILHCTSKFLAHGKVPGAMEYHYRTDIQNNCGKVSSLSITSITITDKTLGARVKLSEKQLQLFDKPEERANDSLKENNNLFQNVTNGNGHYKYSERNLQRKVSGSHFLPNGKTESKKYFCKYKSEGIFKNRSQNKFIDSYVTNIYEIVRPKPLHNRLPLIPVLVFNEIKNSVPSPVKPVSGFGRSAHITLATAPGVKSRQTNFDILDICDIEAINQCDRKPVHVQGGRAVYLGHGMCTVYFYKPLIFKSLFSGFY